MSKKQWLVLLLLFLIYLLLGALIFYHMESGLEKEAVANTIKNRMEIYTLLRENYNSSGSQDDIFNKLSDYCKNPVSNDTGNVEDMYKWDFHNSLLFAYTVVSTIGYGNLAPTTMFGRILMIFYALIGIPMNGILLTQLGEYFGYVFVRAHKKYKDYKNGKADTARKPKPLETRKAGLAAQIFMYLAPGFVMFIFFPAFLFCYVEDWPYDVAVYYAFVTLSTIGFGDYVAGQDHSKAHGHNDWWMVYKVFLLIWISFGLGYLVMIMNFISRGMKSKRITRLEHKLAMNLKHTQSRIWHEFNKDVNYLRRVFNEVYMMKLKPVYRDECEYEVPSNNSTRSQSFPDLRKLIYGGLETSEPVKPRQRANSEVAPMTEAKPEGLNRIASENDLTRIDKKATFASHAMVQSAELLARLVNALGYIPPPSDDEEGESDPSELKGVDGFNDSDILAGEKPWSDSGWRVGDEKFPAPEPRTRAASEIRWQKEDNGFAAHQRNAEWTWSGPTASGKLQELIKARKSGSSTPTKDAKSRIPSFSQPSVSKTTRPRWFNPFSSKKNSRVPSRRESVPGDELETNFRENYLSHTGNTRSGAPLDRRRSATPHYFTHTGGNLPNTPNGNLLEETSLADFLRALTALHSRVGAVPDDFVARPQRKMGTASLTPPKLPSLLALFSPLPGMEDPQIQSTQSTVTGNQMNARRFSLKPSYASAASTPGSKRRGSSFVPPAAGLRRFSLRPEESTVTSTSSYQRRNSLMPGAVPRRFSLKSVFSPAGSPPQIPPYTSDLLPLHTQERQDPPPYSADPFIFECPKEPLVPAEVGPAQDGISLPGRNTRAPRRFSLRPAQIGVPPAPAAPKSSPPQPTARPAVPKWKGGMLQRQISELSLQRRVRALSLGDVHSVNNDRTMSQISPLALPNATSNLPISSPDRAAKTNASNFLKHMGKTVTTVPSASVNLATRTARDSKQNSASSPIDQSSTVGKNTNDVTLPIHKQSEKTEQAGVLDIRGTDIKTVSDSNAAESTTGKMLTAIKIDDHKMSLLSLAKAPSKSLELESVLIDKPFGKSVLHRSPTTDDTLPHHCSSKRDSLIEVKVDPSSSAFFSSARIADDVQKTRTSSIKDQSLVQDFRIPGAGEVSAVSQKNPESTGRKISALSEQSVELSSTSGSRKSSTSARSDKPRVSIDSYKPLLEFRIEKPATNPFEQYKNTVQCKLEKPREKKTAIGSPQEPMKTEQTGKKSATLVLPKSEESSPKFDKN